MFLILQVEEREQAIVEVEKEVVELKVKVEEEAKELEKIHAGLKGERIRVFWSFMGPISPAYSRVT